MYKKVALFLSAMLIIYSCSYNDDISFRREVKELNKEVYYGIDDPKQPKDSLLTLMIKDVNNAFGLGSINKSIADNELRIYYIFPFGEIFFRQQFKNGKTNLELYICNTLRRNDSLFMNIKSLIKSEGNYNYDNSLNANFPSDSLTIDDSNSEDQLDAFATFVFQIKYGSQNKYLLIERPFDIENKNGVTKYVCNLIRNINKNFSFKFYDSWEKIVDSTFIDPYHLKNK